MDKFCLHVYKKSELSIFKLVAGALKFRNIEGGEIMLNI